MQPRSRNLTSSNTQSHKQPFCQSPQKMAGERLFRGVSRPNQIFTTGQPLSYFFILGRNPALSLAEIEAALSQSEYQLESLSEQTAIIKTTYPVADLMTRLGGTIKIGRLEPAKLKNLNDRETLDILAKIITPPEGQKFFFGLSAYALNKQSRLPSLKQLLRLGLSLKNKLKQAGAATRYVSSRDLALSSVIVKTNHLLDRGAELCLFFDKTGIKIGKTSAVQEFAQASWRDYGRPAHEMKVGMLPIQLTKILINLARQPLDATLLDPFCGFGTVLAEAMVMGYKSLIGTDINPQTIDGAKKNMEWLKEKCKMQNAKCKIFVIDARRLSQQFSPSSVDAIVTEPYLGPTKQFSIFNFQFSNLMKELADLYINSFQEFKKVLKPNGRVVFIFPAFKQGNQVIKTSELVLSKIRSLGFNPTPLLSPNTNSTFNIQHSTFSLLYSRPDQKVLREIFVFVQNF